MNNKDYVANSRYNQAMDFVAKLIENMDNIDFILSEVAKHYDADRAYVFEFSDDLSVIDNTYEWCREGVEPQIDNLQNLPYESVEVWVEEFEREGAFYISSLDKDVENTSLTYEILEPQGIESLIAAPVYKEGRILGFVGVDNPHLNTDDIVILQTTAYILYSEISSKITSRNLEIKKITETKEQQDEELGSIKDIIAAANMGIWRIEMVEGEDPRMYVNETMKRLLGIEELSVSPEKTYDDWFYNITPEAVNSVLSSVERMQQGFFDENTYLWNHPTKGVRYVRCGGTAKKIPGGYTLQGYHYDVDEVVRKSQAQMLKLKKALDDKKEYYEVLGALGDIFYSIHVLDLRKDTAQEFSAKGKVKEIANHKDGATEMMRQVIKVTTVDEMHERALEFTELTTIADRMQNKDILSCELKGRGVGWFLASFVTMEKDRAGRPTKVVFVTRVTDEEVQQRTNLIAKTQTDEMTGLLNRRAYEDGIYAHNDTPEEDNFIYVSIDANGLKHANDNYGHAAGDELLIGIAQCMKKSFGSYGHLYRIGGDEFVAILSCSDEEVESVLARFDNEISAWKGELIDKLTLSYGWVSKKEMPGASTRQLGAIAEKRMYEAKSEYYSRNGIDRRGQLDAHRVLCELYTKILKINLSDDSYQIINMDVSEKTMDKGFSPKISDWLRSFGTLGMVHPEDLEEYLKCTDLKNIEAYFKSGKTSLHLFYRRKFVDGFKQVMMEIVPANDYSENNMSLYLYVKNIDR